MSLPEPRRIRRRAERPLAISGTSITGMISGSRTRFRCNGVGTGARNKSVRPGLAPDPAR